MSSRRPRRWLRRLVVTVAILAALGVAVDRVAEWAAEDRLAAMAQEEAAQYDVRAAETKVEIGGFGFLPQLFKQEFSTVTMTMRQPTFTSVPAEDLTVTMSRVHVPRGLLTGEPGAAAVTVDSTDMRLQMSPGELAKLAARTTGLDGLTLRIADGKLQAQLNVRGLDVKATVNPQVRKGRIVLAVAELGDDVPAVVRDAVKSTLARGIAIPSLPFDAKLKEVAVEGATVVLTATMADLKLAG